MRSKERFLRRLERRDVTPSLVHQALAGTVLDDPDRRVGSTAQRIGNRRIQGREALARPRSQRVYKPFFVRAVRDEGPQSCEPFFRSDARPVEGVEKHRVTRKKKAAFTRLGVEQSRQHRAGGLEYVAGMRHAPTRR